MRKDVILGRGSPCCVAPCRSAFGVLGLVQCKEAEGCSKGGECGPQFPHTYEHDVLRLAKLAKACAWRQDKQ
eukprot:5288732-Prorocentrum_lima.AAC.1